MPAAIPIIAGVAFAVDVVSKIGEGIAKNSAADATIKANNDSYKAQAGLLGAQNEHDKANILGDISAGAGAAGMEGGAGTSVGVVAKDASTYLDTIYKYNK